MRKVILPLVGLAVIGLLAGPPGFGAAPAVVFFDDFSRGHDSGWSRSDGAPFYSINENYEYQIYNYGGGDTYSTRADLMLPSSWTFSVDMKVYHSGVQEAGGIALVASSSDPVSNSIRVNVIYDATQDKVALQIHRGDAAEMSGYVACSDGELMRLTVTRAEGSYQLNATLTAPGGTVSLTNTLDLTTQLGACTKPALQVGGGAYAWYLFDNVSISSVAATPAVLTDNFSSGNDNNWHRSDSAPFYSVAGGEYRLENTGGGDIYSLRQDVVLPDHWTYDSDIKASKPLSGVFASGGIALVADSGNPWNNYVRVSACLHETLDLVGLQVHWQDDAAPIEWVPYSQGDKVHLTVVRAPGSNAISARLTASGGTLFATSPDLPTKLAACRTPGVQVGGGADALYLFDNIVIGSPNGLTRPYLSANGIYGTLKYADGFRDDSQIVNLHGGSILEGAVHTQGDKYFIDAISLGKWRQGSTELGAFSTDPNNAIIYRVSVPENGATGYIINGGNIHIGTMVYQHDGQVSLFVSKDGLDWSPPLLTDLNTVDGWKWRYHNISIPAAYCGGEVIYIKMTGSCPDANNWASVDEWGVKLNLKATGQAQLIDRYLSVDGSAGVYKYASGFGDDVNIQSRTAIDFTGALVNSADKYLIDAYSLGTWLRNGTALGAFSSDQNNAIIYKHSMAREGAAGYTITGGQIYLGTRIYQQDAQVSLFVSKDGVNWSPALQRDVNDSNGWVSRDHDITIPAEYIGGDTIYVKMTGACPDANDWASVDGWGISLTLAKSASPVASIGDLRGMDDGSAVQLTSPKVVTTAAGTFTSGACYIEEADRATGIRITGAAGLNVGDRVTLTGTLGTEASGERVIAVGSIDSQTSGAALRPLRMRNTAAAPAATDGLLVTVWGRVSFVALDGSFVYVDDGSLAADGTGHNGVRIALDDQSTSITNVFGGSPYVSITGAAGRVRDGALSVRAIRPRSDADVTSF